MAAGRKASYYEHISQPVAQFPDYLRRQLRSIGIGAVFICVALYAGMLGYHYLVGLSWIDAYENAAKAAEKLLSTCGRELAPKLLDAYAAIIWEDQDECLEVRPEFGIL